MSVEELLTPVEFWLSPGYCRKDFVKLTQVPGTLAVVETQRSQWGECTVPSWVW